METASHALSSLSKRGGIVGIAFSGLKIGLKHIDSFLFAGQKRILVVLVFSFESHFITRLIRIDDNFKRRCAGSNGPFT